MSNKIGKLILRKFRGATDETTFEFDPEKKLVVIFGENGTGKTTVLDAIDFACNKNNEVSLKNKSVGTQKYRYLASLSSQLSDLEVEIETTNHKKCIARFGNRGDISVNSGLPLVKVLRRDSILKIVNGQPKERFEEIREMVSYPQIKQIEDALRETQKDINASYEDAVRAFEQEESNLKSFWEEVGDRTEDFMDWAKERSATDKDDLEKQKIYSENLWRKITNLQTTRENICVDEKNLTGLAEELAEKNTELQTTIGNESEKEGLVELLERAKEYFEKQREISSCPVCTNDIKKDSLTADIESRIAQMRDLKKIQDEIKSITSRKHVLENQLDERKQSFNNIVTDIQACMKNNDITSEQILQSVDKWAMVSVNAQKDFNQLALIQRSYKNFLDKKHEAEKFSKKSDKIQHLVQELELVRKKTVDSILIDISSSVERMYLRVHPNEGIGSVKFYLDPKKSESLEFSGLFQGDSVPPQAYYSESHLDTLGVCVFLALSWHSCRDGVVLLDDVLTSVDQRHMARFIDMLEDESKNFQQVIISTHYRLWRDRYRLPVKQSHDVQLIELLPWTSESGVRHTRTKFYVDEIRDAINERKFDRQKVASKSGILLEHLLDEISLKYACKVPRKSDHRFTLGELFEAVDSKIRKHLSVSKNTKGPVFLQDNLNEIQNTTFVRNEVGCHYSDIGALLADSDVKDFGDKVVGFAESLLCEACGAFPNKNKSGSYWECHCGDLKLSPLVRP